MPHDYADLCRSTRQFANNFTQCEHREMWGFIKSWRRGCVQANIAVVLEALQLSAFADLKVKVYRAVGHKLPRELTDHIFTYLLQAEDIPDKPRIFDPCGNGRAKCEGIPWPLQRSHKGCSYSLEY